MDGAVPRSGGLHHGAVSRNLGAPALACRLHPGRPGDRARMARPPPVGRHPHRGGLRGGRRAAARRGRRHRDVWAAAADLGAGDDVTADDLVAGTRAVRRGRPTSTGTSAATTGCPTASSWCGVSAPASCCRPRSARSARRRAAGAGRRRRRAACPTGGCRAGRLPVARPVAAAVTAAAGARRERAGPALASGHGRRRRRRWTRRSGRPVSASWCWGRADEDAAAFFRACWRRSGPVVTVVAGEAEAVVIIVLILASGAAWESPALRLLEREPGGGRLKRCVDVHDLLAAATPGRPTPRWSPSTPRASTPPARPPAPPRCDRWPWSPPARPRSRDRLRAARLGISTLVDDDRALADAVTAVEDVGAPTRGPTTTVEPDPWRRAAGAPGRSGAPAGWSPCGDRPAPRAGRRSPRPGRRAAARGGRTTPGGRRPLRRGRRPAARDPRRGLRACSPRPGWRPGGTARAEPFASVQRGVDDHLTVVTGLPRPTAGSRSAPARRAPARGRRGHGHVVVDTGFSLEDDPALDFGPGRPQPDDAGRAGAGRRGRGRRLRRPGRACPGLARGLVELRETRPAARRCGSSSTGCGLRSAGRRRTSRAWSRASPGWPACTSCPTQAGRRPGPGGRAHPRRAGRLPLGRGLAGTRGRLAPGTAAPGRRPGRAGANSR